MAQYSEDPLRRTDATEARFQKTVLDDRKHAAPQEGLKSVPRGGPDAGIHIDKPISVTETGYGGVSGRGNDISAIVHDTKPGPKLDHEGGESFTKKAKDVATGVKDLASGKKQKEAAHPVVDQSKSPTNHGHGGQGMRDKMKEFITGQKPGQGMESSEGLEEWPSNAKAPNATYTNDR